MQPEQKTFFQKYKKEIIIASISLVIFITAIYFIFLRNTNNLNTGTGSLASNNKSGFSFGSLLDIFNNNNNAGTNNVDINNLNNNNYSDYYVEGLMKVWSRPVAGYGYYYKQYKYTYNDENGEEKTDTGTKAILQFVDSDTGYIYEKDLSAPTSSPIQITDTSYPNIVRAYFINDNSNNKSRVILQYLSGTTIKTISANIPDYYGSTGKLISVTALPDNIKYFTVSHDNKKAAYTVLKNRTSYGRQDTYTDWYLIVNSNDLYGDRIYSSELTSWKLLLDNSSTIYAFTGDTAYETNSLYKLDNDNNLSQIYSNHNGMSFLLGDNSLLISIFTANGLKTYENNNFIGSAFTDTSINKLSFNTLVNKCGESSTNGEELIICGVPKEIKKYDSGLPDAWYQGMTSWDDNLYIVNNNYANGQLLFDINNDGGITETIDIKNLNIENTNSHLAFINKNDGSLWTLNIANILYQGD